MRLQEVEGFSNSYYHLPSSAVQRSEEEERNGVSHIICSVILIECVCLSLWQYSLMQYKWQS